MVGHRRNARVPVPRATKRAAAMAHFAAPVKGFVLPAQFPVVWVTRVSLLILLAQLCHCKGGGGYGGTTSSTEGYYTGYESNPGYSGYDSGYGYNSGNRPYGYPPRYYGSTPSYSQSSSGAWFAFLFPIMFIFCCMCFYKPKTHSTNGPNGMPTGHPVGGPRQKSKHFKNMQKSDRMFLQGRTPGPYLGQAQPILATNHLYSLPEKGGMSRWRGSYTENGVTKHMSYELNFSGRNQLEGPLNGTGFDDDGSFRLTGMFNMRTGRLIWTELYPSGMQTAIQQQGIASLGTTAIQSMSGTYCSDTGITGDLSMIPDLELGPITAQPLSNAALATSPLPSAPPVTYGAAGGGVPIGYGGAPSAAYSGSTPAPGAYGGPTYSSPQPPPGYPSTSPYRADAPTPSTQPPSAGAGSYAYPPPPAASPWLGTGSANSQPPHDVRI